ncbi:hypothetical protein QAD02_010642 [Eretmocerus hayati]|uniref:Uncharacterized protein n=1 Tax=Eretmocerus hayati TaxID=131215 RepID=A0ACC2NUM2_9HYME|nr:hypothetical protein QAD02_010642 [Eretmocerus hayati]
MDALLPSEVARLVLGYLQEQRCDEAAKLFMETSPLLQEVHVVAKRGGRYSTRVGGSSLADILDKYCSVNAMIQDKLSKVSDSEQLKHCNDLLEQLRYLLDGSTRSHKFVVNINMPQNSPAGTFGSPSLSGSSKKRHLSHSEKSKRAARSLNNALEKSVENCEQRICDNIETTPHGTISHGSVLAKSNHSQNLVDKDIEICNGLGDITSSAKENGNAVTTTHPDLHSTTPNLINNDNNHAHNNFELESAKTKCTAETSTEELMSYSSAEVQTRPCDFLDFESEINDDPIQNLTIITKELMQRSELTERIAENINKSMIPVEGREENPNESVADANKSLLTEFDNAIKSVVDATNNDPVFEGFLKEIFAVGESEEDSDGRKNQTHHVNAGEVIEIESGALESEKCDTHDGPPNESDVPLKQRLRSGSLRPQVVNLDDEEKENSSSLEDQNAQAVMNIVNVIASKRNSLTLESEPIIIDPALSNDHPVDSVETDPLAGVPPDHGVEDGKSKTSEKPRAKRARKPRKVTKKKIPPALEEVPTVPTLILCSEEEALARGLDGNYRPIAPKPGSVVSEPQQRKIVLRTVNVPRHLLTPSQIELLQVPQSSPLKMPQLSQPSPLKIPPKIVLGPGSAVKHQPQESITLYGSGSSPANTITSNNTGGTPSAEFRMGSISSMPIINLDEATVSLATGTGLSPFFKICSGNGPTFTLSPTEKGVIAAAPDTATSTDATEGSDGANICIYEEKPPIEQIEEALTEVPAQVIEAVKREIESRTRTTSSSGDGIIAKRTPRSLLRSRSKNNRLSLSTPRRRRSHVRALDFGTPAKFHGQGIVEEEPPPPPPPRRVPIATRSPAPKLVANWNKISGIGLIIGSGDSSASETSADCFSSPEKLPKQPKQDQQSQSQQPKSAPKTTAPGPPPKSWDSDLRNLVGPGSEEPEETRTRAKNSRKPRKKVANGACLSIKDCAVATPEFPVTPCIVLTPKFMNDDDPANRKPSPYYEPELQPTPKTVVEEIVLETTATTTTTTVAKLVVKKDEPELQKNEQLIERAKSIDIVPAPNHDSGDESTDSDSSRKSSKADDSLPSSPVHAESGEPALDSSSANNSVNNSADNSANNSANTSASSAQIQQQIVNDTEQTPEERVEDRQRADFLSPTSMKAIAGSGEGDEPTEIVKETPAKMLVDEEAIISDTPCVSEAERAARRDSLTGLTSKMTAIIGASQPTNSKTNLENEPAPNGANSSPTKDGNQLSTSVKPKIVDIQKLAPGDGMTLQLSKMMQTESQRLNPLSVLKDNTSCDASKVHFSVQLEEKRQRLVAKLKQTNTKAPAKKVTDDGKPRRSAPGKKGIDTDKVVSSTSDQLEKIEKRIDINDPAKSKTNNTYGNAKYSSELTTNESVSRKSSERGISSPSKKVSKVNQSRDQDEKLNAISSSKKATNQCPSASSSSASSSSSQSTVATVAVKATGAVADHPKGISKSRVDQVKRDLFSDDEVNDQRTTRSQTARQVTIDSQKKESDKVAEKAIPGVLECLQLRPANKSDLEMEKESEDEYGFRDNSTTECGEISFVYDESVPIKKRKRKYSSSELQNEYTIQFPDEAQILRVTELEEMFKIAPTSKKKKVSCSKKKHDSRKHREISPERPLANSSPVTKVSKKSHSHEKKKSCKRKHSPLKETKVEKKTKIDPQALFNKIKVDEFLKAVHVPEK